MILDTFNGFNVIALPSDTVPGVDGPASIEWDRNEMVAETDQAFGYQDQIFDWMQSMWSGQLSFAPMARWSADYWEAFLSELRGPVNAFQIGDPMRAIPKGSPKGAPVVSGAGQTGYSLITRGWADSSYRLLLPGDHIQIGYRMYKTLDSVQSDASGNATFRVWPNLRDQPADGTQIKVSNCRGLFRLQSAQGNKSSTNIGSFGVNALAIREADIA